MCIISASYWTTVGKFAQQMYLTICEMETISKYVPAVRFTPGLTYLRGQRGQMWKSNLWATVVAQIITPYTQALIILRVQAY